MPAWGRTHDDQLIWDMVAFVRTLPGMSAEQYKAAVASAPADHDEMMKDMPGMKPMKGMTPEGNASAAGPTSLKDAPHAHGQAH